MPRKIETKMIDALKNNQNVSFDNTTVSNGSVYLHGNEILRLTDDRIMFNFCGWITKTTTSRISQALREFSNGDVSIKKGNPVLWLNGEATVTASNSWIILGRKNA